MVYIGDGIYGPARTAASYPYPIQGEDFSETTDDPSSSQAHLLGTGLAAPPRSYPSHTKRPLPISRHKRSRSAVTSMASPTKALADLSRLNPFAKSTLESHQSLNRRVHEGSGETGRFKKIQRRFTISNGSSR